MEKVGTILRKTLVLQIQDGVKESGSVFVLSYSRVSASQMDTLRKDLKRLKAHLRVSKNRLAQIALSELKQDPLAGRIAGQTAFIWSSADVVPVSKTIIKFSEQCDGVVVRGGLLEGAVLEPDDIKRLSDLPSREILLSQLLQTMISPVTRLAGSLNAKSRDLLSILKQLSEKKGGT